MPRGKGIYDDEDADEPKGGRPGPTDEGGEGGMATRENTPDVDETQRGADGLTAIGRLCLPGCAGRPRGENR